MVYVYCDICLLDSVCYGSSVSAVFTSDSEIGLGFRVQGVWNKLYGVGTQRV